MHEVQQAGAQDWMPSMAMQGQCERTHVQVAGVHLGARMPALPTCSLSPGATARLMSSASGASCWGLSPLWSAAGSVRLTSNAAGDGGVGCAVGWMAGWMPVSKGRGRAWKWEWEW